VRASEIFEDMTRRGFLKGAGATAIGLLTPKALKAAGIDDKLRLECTGMMKEITNRGPKDAFKLKISVTFNLSKEQLVTDFWMNEPQKMGVYPNEFLAWRYKPEQAEELKAFPGVYKLGERIKIDRYTGEISINPILRSESKDNNKPYVWGLATFEGKCTKLDRKF
jgi:hypothetical protein